MHLVIEGFVCTHFSAIMRMHREAILISCPLEGMLHRQAVIVHHLAQFMTTTVSLIVDEFAQAKTHLVAEATWLSDDR